MENSIKIIEFKEPAFDWDDTMVVYVETEYSPLFNVYIRHHYKELCQEFQRLGLTFVYLPLLHSLGMQARRFLHDRLQWDTLDTLNIIQNMYSSEELSQIDGPSLIWPVCRVKDENLYWCWSLNTSSNPMQCFLDFLSDCYQRQLRGSLLGADMRNLMEKDDAFLPLPMGTPGPNELFLVRQVRQSLQGMVDSGMPFPSIKPLIAPDMRLSKLLITKDYHLFLTDFDNVEIELKPVQMALYLLFLNHPEGIYLKHLQDYKSELYQIYGKVSGKWNVITKQATVYRLCDPTDNNVNVILSRIKKAFLQCRNIDEKILEQYYISGEQSEIKRILLDRGLIVWEQ